MRRLFLLSLLLLFGCKEQPYVVEDLTDENLFSENIEGPLYRDGILYVVNYQKDGMFSHSDKFNQPNDICISKNGYLFASDPNWKESTGQLWRIETTGEAVLLKDSMGTINGIELSPDEKILYVNESVQRKIWKFDVDEKGDISNQQLFAEVPDFGFDGMKCDKEGNLYVICYGKGTIAIFSAEGELLREVEMKGKKTSNIAFGGADGKTWYVTLQDRKCVEVFESEIAGKSY